MYQFFYAEILDDTPRVARARERQAIEHSIELLEIARQAGPNSREATEALAFLRRLWAILIEDLTKPENQLPESLRADLISIGLFILKEADNISLSQTPSFDGLIEISSTISRGLS